MGDPFLDPLLARMVRSQRAGMRIGTLTAIDAANGSVTVSLAGDVVSGMRWVGSYSPAVADTVVVSRVDAMWVVLGKLSKQLATPSVVYGEQIITPMSSGVFFRNLPGAGWSRGLSVGSSSRGQGRNGDQLQGGAWFLPVITPPPGATVTSATLAIARDPAAYYPPTLSPVLYWHSYRPETWLSGESGLLPTLNGGPWRPGTLEVGQRAVWPLPTAWLTAFLAGTARGIAIYSDAYADWGLFGGAGTPSLTIRYTVPA